MVMQKYNWERVGKQLLDLLARFKKLPFAGLLLRTSHGLLFMGCLE